MKVLFTTEEIHFYRFPLAALESVFERMKGLFNRWSRICSPCLVTHLADLGECLNLKIWVEGFRYEVFEKGNEDGTVMQKTYQIEVWSVVDADGYASTVFACPQFIDKIKEAKYGFFLFILPVSSLFAGGLPVVMANGRKIRQGKILIKLYEICFNDSHSLH